MSTFPGKKHIMRGDGSRKPYNINRWRPKGTPGFTMNYLVTTRPGGIFSSALPICSRCGNVISQKKLAQTSRRLFSPVHKKCLKREPEAR